jgi:hypothetical protein
LNTDSGRTPAKARLDRRILPTKYSKEGFKTDAGKNPHQPRVRQAAGYMIFFSKIKSELLDRIPILDFVFLIFDLGLKTRFAAMLTTV